jgi:hypothetical protein
MPDRMSKPMPAGRWTRRNKRGVEAPRGRFRMRRTKIVWRKMQRVIVDDEPWEWKTTQVPAPLRRAKSRARNKIARKSRKVNRATTK